MRDTEERYRLAFGANLKRGGGWRVGGGRRGLSLSINRFPIDNSRVDIDRKPVDAFGRDLLPSYGHEEARQPSLGACPASSCPPRGPQCGRYRDVGRARASTKKHLGFLTQTEPNMAPRGLQEAPPRRAASEARKRLRVLKPLTPVPKVSILCPQNAHFGGGISEKPLLIPLLAI